MSNNFVKVENNFAAMLKKMQIAANDALIETGAEVLAEVKANAPRKTGEFADSYEMVKDGDTIEIGSPLERSRTAEFGGSRRPARPHLTPAAIKSGEKLQNNLKEKLNKNA